MIFNFKKVRKFLLFTIICIFTFNFHVTLSNLDFSVNENGDNILHILVRQNNVAGIQKYLADERCDNEFLNAKNNEGLSAFDEAANLRLKEICKLLIAKQAVWPTEKKVVDWVKGVFYLTHSR